MSKKKTPAWQYALAAVGAAAAVGGIAYAVTRDEEDPAIGGFERTEEIDGINVGDDNGMTPESARIMAQWWAVRG